jgi:hypothetical protein
VTHFIALPMFIGPAVPPNLSIYTVVIVGSTWFFFGLGHAITHVNILQCFSGLCVTEGAILSVAFDYPRLWHISSQGNIPEDRGVVPSGC